RASLRDLAADQDAARQGQLDLAADDALGEVHALRGTKVRLAGRRERLDGDVAAVRLEWIAFVRRVQRDLEAPLTVGRRLDDRVEQQQGGVRHRLARVLVDDAPLDETSRTQQESAVFTSLLVRGVDLEIVAIVARVTRLEIDGHIRPEVAEDEVALGVGPGG